LEKAKQSPKKKYTIQEYPLAKHFILGVLDKNKTRYNQGIKEALDSFLLDLP
jgi:hypothetical protein